MTSRQRWFSPRRLLLALTFVLTLTLYCQWRLSPHPHYCARHDWRHLWAAAADLSTRYWLTEYCSGHCHTLSYMFWSKCQSHTCWRHTACPSHHSPDRNYEWHSHLHRWAKRCHKTSQSSTRVLIFYKQAASARVLTHTPLYHDSTHTVMATVGCVGQRHLVRLCETRGVGSWSTRVLTRVTHESGSGFSWWRHCTYNDVTLLY